MNLSIEYVFFATAWSSVHGGINSFNYDLCRAIAAEGVRVWMVLPNDADFPGESQGDIKLIQIPESFEKFGSKSIDQMKAKIPVNGDLVWIGHDAVTGGVAQVSANRLGGTSVIFHHMDYSNY